MNSAAWSAQLPDPGSAYAEARQRITALVGAIAPGQANQISVQACPGWTVHDVVAHLVGNVRDVLAGRLNGIGTNGWTEHQVFAARGVELTALLAEWEQIAPQYQEVLRRIGRRADQAVADIITHEHDLRAALGQPGERDTPAVLLSASYVAELFAAAADARRRRVLVKVSGGGAFGPRDAEYVLTGSPWEVLRIITGRRSPEQIAPHINMDTDEIRDLFSFSPEGLPDWTGSAAFVPAAAALPE